MSDEMKLLMAMCKAMGFEVEIKQVRIAVQGERDPVAVPFCKEYVVTKRVDEVDLINDTFNSMFGDVKTELSSLSVREKEPVNYPLMFLHFLDEHNIYIKFMVCMAQADRNWWGLHEAIPEHYIVNAFPWGGEEAFWDNLDNQWQAQLKTVKGE